MKQTIIVFTRHQLTKEQIDAAFQVAVEDKGFLSLADEKDCQTIYLKDSASVNIVTTRQAKEIAEAINTCYGEHYNPDPTDRKSILGIFGVFPAVLLRELEKTGLFFKTSFYSAWNTSRTPEGATSPTFEFKEWVKLPLR